MLLWSAIAHTHLLVEHEVFVVFQRVFRRLALTIHLACQDVQAALPPLQPIRSIGCVLNVAPECLQGEWELALDLATLRKLDDGRGAAPCFV